MSGKIHPRLLVALIGLAGLLPAPGVWGQRAPGTTTAPALPVGDWAALKVHVKATDEEWSILLPQLLRICALREEVHTTDASPQDRRGLMGGPFDSPMGGTSLDAPVMPGRRGPGPPTGRSGPFDPKRAPGAMSSSTSPLRDTLRAIAGQAMIGMLLPDQGHPVRAVLAELQTSLNGRDSSDDQIREKLAAVRAVRKKMARDLESAQKELEPYLTPQQTAVLVNLGYLD